MMICINRSTRHYTGGRHTNSAAQVYIQGAVACAATSQQFGGGYSTVTDFARFLGLWL